MKQFFMMNYKAFIKHTSLVTLDAHFFVNVNDVLGAR